jgi:hypothetical protein
VSETKNTSSSSRGRWGYGAWEEGI